MSMKSMSVLVLACLVGGVLGGCADAADETTATSGTDQSVTSAPDDAAVTSSPPEDEPQETAAPTSDEASADDEASDDADDDAAGGDDRSDGDDTKGNAAGGAPASNDPSCLHGRWVADNDFFLAGVQEFGDAVTSVEGKVVLEFFPDGTVETDYQEWLVTGAADGQEVQISRVGLDTSTYSATPTTLTVVDDYVGSMLAVSIGEQVMVLDPQPITATDVAYTCSASSVRIVTPDGELKLSRN